VPRLKRVLVANRGEIAIRIIRACFDEGVESVAAISEADRGSMAARTADRAVVIGPAAAAESYLSIERVVSAALATGCDAVHPGYGFLSERPDLVDACDEHGLVFIGPPAEVMRRSGDKLSARAVASRIGIPTSSGSPSLDDMGQALAYAGETDDFPYVLKASAGGGGRGMTVVRDLSELERGFELSRQEALSAFGDGTVYLERYVERARHVEVQVLADRFGRVVHLGERDCSVQRRHQKLIEESPATDLAPSLVEDIRTSAVALATDVGYVGAGTVEFLVDVDRGSFTFLEVNARVQVEHPVTEMVCGVDIVRWQLRIAGDEPLGFSQEDVKLAGHSIECRINAEDPDAGFAPNPGTLTEWIPPAGHGIRVDTYAQPGASVAPYYDSMVAKLIVHAADRPRALDLMRRALARTHVQGVATTIPLHAAILASPDFLASPVTTHWLEGTFMGKWEQRDPASTLYVNQSIDR
jgi:acetyl-CoA carboxylase, biotin carboxylase subunit